MATDPRSFPAPSEPRAAHPRNPIRAGWIAILLDAVVGAATWAALVGSPRAMPAPLVFSLTALMVGLLRIYNAQWQPTWPLRLAIAVATATAGSVLLSPLAVADSAPAAGVLTAHGAAVFLKRGRHHPPRR